MYNFLDFCNIFAEYKHINDIRLINHVGNRVSLFCHDTYFLKKKINKDKFFESHKNYGVNCFKLPSFFKLDKFSDTDIVLFTEIFKGHLPADYIRNQHIDLECAIYEPFDFFRENMNPIVYPKHFDV